MIRNLNDFINEFERIKALGWITTHRSGPTGIGKTLEDLLGIPENNIGEPDFGNYELKASRVNSNSMLTLFTKSPLPLGSNTLLRMKFGYSSNAYDNDEKVLHSTLNAINFVRIQNTGHYLRLHCSDERITIESRLGLENCYWDKRTLRDVFNRKYPHRLVFAKAESRGVGSLEQFWFTEAYEISGFSFESMLDLLEEGRILVDLRIGQYPDGRTHDHGTGFRIKESEQINLFREIVRIC